MKELLSYLSLFYTATEIANHIKVSPSTIRRWMRIYKIVPMHRYATNTPKEEHEYALELLLQCFYDLASKKGPKETLPAESVDEFVEKIKPVFMLYSNKQIAKEVGFSVSTIQKFRKAYNLYSDSYDGKDITQEKALDGFATIYRKLPYQTKRPNENSLDTSTDDRKLPKHIRTLTEKVQWHIRLTKGSPLTMQWV